MSQPPQPPDQSPDSAAAGGEDAQPFIITLPDDPASGNDWYLWAAVLALLALVAFWPAINGTFLWDDDQYVTQNRALSDPDGLKQIWSIPPGTIQYYPLTFTALWIEHHFWANNSLGYRVVNLLLHAGGAIILWRILRRLSIPAAWAAAAIWAVHPLQAESVCWISELKNVLSGILALSCALFYLEFVGLRDPEAKERIWNLTEDWQLYAISAGFFVLALLAKTVVCVVPVALLFILWWKRRNSKLAVLGLLPMLVIGAALAGVTSRLETDPNGPIGASGPEWQLSFVQRMFIAGRGFWFYIAKLALPIHQSFVYPRFIPAGGEGIAYLVAAALVVVVLAIGIKKFGAGPLTAVLCYGALLFPALGFFNVYPFRFSFVADHYQYLAGIPLIVLVVAILARILSPIWEKQAAADPAPGTGRSAAVAVLIAAVLLVLGITSWARATVFAEPGTLWQDVLQPGKNPDSWLAAYNLAKLRQSDAVHSFEDAASYLQTSDEVSSKQSADDALALLDESDRLIQKVLDNPTTPDDIRYRAEDQLAENDITRLRSPGSNSVTLMQHAAGELTSALAIHAAQNDPLPFYTLGIVNLNRAQDLQKRLAPSTERATVTVTTQSATTRPYSPDEQQIVDLDKQAQDNFLQAATIAVDQLKSNTVGPEALRVLPLAVFQRGNIDWTLAALSRAHNDVNSEKQYSKEAADDYNDAVNFNPTSVDVRYRLALALENLGDLPHAKEQLLYILTNLDDKYAPAYNEVGRVILELGPTSMEEFQAAVESIKTALTLDPNMIGAQRNLSLALKMLATSRPVTQPATAPASRPSP
jgi:tetratricopeptide (TPR) repeat protein